jgi:hypothetical protein
MLDLRYFYPLLTVFPAGEHYIEYREIWLNDNLKDAPTP